MIQLDLFLTREESEIIYLRRECARIAESSDKVRRGTYAAINNLGKKFTEQEQRLQEMEHKLWVIEKFIKENLK